MVLYICEYRKGFQHTERTQVYGRNDYVQRAVTTKVGKQELCFMIFIWGGGGGEVYGPFKRYFIYIEPIVHQRWAKT